MVASRLVRIFLSSPSDVADERGIAHCVIHALNHDPLLRNRIVCQIIDWVDPDARTPMLATLTPQAAIAKGLPKPSECDIVVVIVWARMGTPLPNDSYKPDGSRYLSTTDWEYEDAVRASNQTGRPLVTLYRRTQDPSFKLSTTDFNENYKQWQHVQDFFKHFTTLAGDSVGGYNAYQTPDNFRRALEYDLKVLIQQVLDQDRIVASVSHVADVEQAFTWLDEFSPFPGLRPFTPEEAMIFFGRSKDTDALLNKVAETRFVTVVGASGSGKSSLVAAGLLPRLQANAIPGSKDWRWVRLTPGARDNNPFLSLVTALIPNGQRPDDLALSLADNPARFLSVVQSILEDGPSWAELVVVVDQFEELFTTVHPRFRAPFISLLGFASIMERVRIIATLRSDFYHNCLEYPVLALLLRDGSFPLTAPDRSALYEMITRPAIFADLDYENDLAWHLVDETERSLGALAYTLAQLFHVTRRNSDRQLAYAAYEALGGVRGAINVRADQMLSHLDAEAQGAMPDVFRRFVIVDERKTAMRQRVLLSHFDENEAAQRFIAAGIDAHLFLVTETQPELVVELAHDVLFESWQQLSEWIDLSWADERLSRHG